MAMGGAARYSLSAGLHWFFWVSMALECNRLHAWTVTGPVFLGE
jgi:hypothetical protein